MFFFIAFNRCFEYLLQTKRWRYVVWWQPVSLTAQSRYLTIRETVFRFFQMEFESNLKIFSWQSYTEMIKIKYWEKCLVAMSFQLNSTCRFLWIEQAGIWTPLTLCSSLAPQSSASSENSTTHTHHKNSPVHPGTSTPQRAQKIYNSSCHGILCFIPGTLYLPGFSSVLFKRFAMRYCIRYVVLTREK
jgi:hypothetical protein